MLSTAVFNARTVRAHIFYQSSTSKSINKIALVRKEMTPMTTLLVQLLRQYNSYNGYNTTITTRNNQPSISYDNKQQQRQRQRQVVVVASSSMTTQGIATARSTATRQQEATR